MIFFDLGNVICPHTPFRERAAERLAHYSRLAYQEIFDIFNHCSSGSRNDQFWAAIDAFDRGDFLPYEFYLRMSDILELGASYREFEVIWRILIEVESDFLDLLKKLHLRRKPRLGIISNLCIIHHQKIFKVVSRDLFDISIFSFVEGGIKPNPTIFLRAIRAANLPPQNILFVDDRIDNINAAGKLGMQVYHYADLSHFDKFVGYLQERGLLR